MKYDSILYYVILCNFVFKLFVVQHICFKGYEMYSEQNISQEIGYENSKVAMCTVFNDT